MKTKFANALKALLVLSALIMNSCQDDTTDSVKENSIETQLIENLKKELTTPTSQELPQAVQNQLNLSKANLSNYLNDELKITEVEVLGKLSTNKGIITAQNVVSNEESTLAFGNIKDKKTVVIGKMKKIYSGNALATTKKNISEIAVKEIQLEDNLLKITWVNKGQKFTSLCFYRNSGIVWDNVLSGLIMMDPKGKTESSNEQQSKILSKWYKQWWTASWLWGSDRGEIGYQITIYYSGSTVSNTDVSDWGHMSLGSARSESKITKETGSYGQCRYALGLCTPTGSLSFSYSSFSVSFSGLGSNIVSNGYKSLYP
ncbi:hypothetical protein NAT51_14490 [Flavobacterium amniphilum]|uniref:hypothetical protein n=1 Tax=Flavobacterium amniphilum TaxID=1834035 RepID=UPI00202A1DEF|nr:hypothetical protein [Flavobacterium amniphilum]MCL9806739.1 hypothetical protein [Flavobacterium amniphilum]